MQALILALAAGSGMYARSAIGPLQEAVKHSLAMSDNQVALLQGFAMALPIALGAIPLGLLADRVARTRMLLFFMVAALLSFVLGAFATTFALLFVARCIAGIASIALMIAAFSIVSDLYEPAERGRASMILVCGEILGSPLAFALGGSVLVAVGAAASMRIDSWGLEEWRWALLWMGTPLILILLLQLLVREPARTGMLVEKPPLRVVWAELWKFRSMVILLLAARAMVWVAEGAVFVWGAPLFARKFHLAPDKVGALMGIALLVGGVLGPAIGGPLADYFQRRGGSRQVIRILAGVAALTAPSALFAFMPSAFWTCVLLAIFLTLGIAILTAGVTVSIVVIPGELRGLYLGMTYTAGGLFFVGVAPILVSSLSGALGGEAMVGEALTIVCVGASLLGAVIFAFSARYFPGEGPASSRAGALAAPIAGA